MGLDMYLFRFKKVTESEALALNGLHDEVIHQKGYTVLSPESKELFKSILGFGRKINVIVTFVDIERIKKENDIDEDARITYSGYGNNCVDYGFSWHDKNALVTIHLEESQYKTFSEDEWGFLFELRKSCEELRNASFHDCKQLEDGSYELILSKRDISKHVELSSEKLKDYLYDEKVERYVFNRTEVRYWRKNYDLQEFFYDLFAPWEVENCGYYRLNKKRVERLNTYFKRNNMKFLSDEIGGDECYAYFEWY